MFLTETSLIIREFDFRWSWLVLSENRGLMLVLATAIISGFSIFINSFVVKGFNPFVFTTLKNAFVALFLIAAILLLTEWKNLAKLTKQQWVKLATVGLIGGSIPFLLFFYALKIASSATTAGFLQKTIFVWATIFAIVFLREKINKMFIAGAALLLLGNFLLFSNLSTFDLPEILVLIAAVMWGLEIVLAKHLLNDVSGRVVAFGRMFFGAGFMLLFLAATGQLQDIGALTTEHWMWIAITGILLFFYVFTFYTGLKYTTVSKATAVLLLGQPITGVLSMVFSGKALGLNETIGFMLIIAGVVLVIGITYFASLLKSKGVGLAAIRY